MNFKKTIYLIIGLVLIGSFCFSVVIAADFRIDKKGGNITIDKDEKVKNLYTGGNMISINGDIEKSLYVGGNIISINGNVEGSINAGGSTIVIRGNVGDSVHAGGGNILIEGIIEEDLFIGGGNITISKSASIGGDLIIGGGTVDIQGPVVGDVKLGGGQVTINSKIGGQVNAKVDELTLGPQAEIVKDLIYTSPKEASIDENAKILGTVDYEKVEIKKLSIFKSKGLLFGILTLGFLIKVLMGIVAGLVLIYLFGKMIKRTVKESLANFWANLGKGFAALILTPIAAIIILVTIIGAPLAGLIGTGYVLIISLSSILASITFGSWLIKVIKKRDEYLVNWQAVVLGVIVLKIVVLIPYIGWLVGLVFMLVGLGVIYRMVYQNIALNKAK